MRISFLGLAAIIFLTIAPACSSQPINLVANPGFEEGIQANGLPVLWSTFNDPGLKPTFSVLQRGRSSEDEGSSGKCARVYLPQSGRALLISRPIPVAPGEKLQASVWMRGDGFAAAAGGSVVFTIGCLASDRTYFHWLRFRGWPEEGRWTKFEQSFVVPDGTSLIVLQIGLGNARGAVLFDDAAIIPENPWAVRIDTEEEISPASPEVTLTILNRKEIEGNARITLKMGKAVASREITLLGKPEQVEIIGIRPIRGRAEASVTLEDLSGVVLARSHKTLKMLGLVELDPLVPTHFCIEDGAPHLSGRIWLYASPEELKGASIETRLIGADGGVLVSRKLPSVPDKTSQGSCERRHQAAFIDFDLEAPGAPRGDYILEAELKTAKGEIASDRQDWHIISRSQAKVTISDDGYPVVDGKPIFPLGTFNSGRYELMKRIGFNTVHAWNRARTGSGVRPKNQPAKDFLDDAHRAGMKALLLVPSTLAQEGRWDEVVRRIRMFRNHPALLAWVEEEGVARGEMKKETLDKLVGILRKEDPNHPFCLADSYTRIEETDRKRFFDHKLMDIGMWWWYPIPIHPSASSSALEGEDASKSMALTPPSFLSIDVGGKPLWVGLQAYRKSKVIDGRLPTDAEYRAMAYLAAISGAKGMFYYMGGSAYSVEGYSDTDRPWGYLNDLVPELAGMLPVFMSANAPTQARVEPPSVLISCLVKQSGSVRTIIAINRDDKPVEASLSLPDLPDGSIEVRFENRTIVPLKGRIKDHFAPYEVHIYEVR